MPLITRRRRAALTCFVIAAVVLCALGYYLWKVSLPIKGVTPPTPAVTAIAAPSSPTAATPVAAATPSAVIEATPVNRCSIQIVLVTSKGIQPSNLSGTYTFTPTDGSPQIFPLAKGQSIYPFSGNCGWSGTLEVDADGYQTYGPIGVNLNAKSQIRVIRLIPLVPSTPPVATPAPKATATPAPTKPPVVTPIIHLPIIMTPTEAPSVTASWIVVDRDQKLPVPGATVKLVFPAQIKPGLTILPAESGATGEVDFIQPAWPTMDMAYGQIVVNAGWPWAQNWGPFCLGQKADKTHDVAQCNGKGPDVLLIDPSTLKPKADQEHLWISHRAREVTDSTNSDSSMVSSTYCNDQECATALAALSSAFGLVSLEGGISCSDLTTLPYKPPASGLVLVQMSRAAAPYTDSIVINKNTVTEADAAQYSGWLCGNKEGAVFIRQGCNNIIAWVPKSTVEGIIQQPTPVASLERRGLREAGTASLPSYFKIENEHRRH